ncbi:hypothetical protein GCM10023168_25030 [Fodinibacter luteus]|uniref:Single-stranded DNA-binding protein n=1 Tax=Fodinibacter luteus TaxID=552064 RepID=A0ABP8KKA3_9MICO
MNETYVTIRGRLVADPTVRTTRAGAPMTSFRIASSVRRPVPGQHGAWEDVGTSFYEVVTYKALAANAGVSLRKGHPVSVHGRQHIVSRPRDDGTTWWGVEVVADAVGHDLAYGTTAFAKVGRAQDGGGDRAFGPEPPDGFVDRTSGFGTSGFGSPDTDAYVVEGADGRGLGQLAAPGDDGSSGGVATGTGSGAGPAPDTGPLVPSGDEAAA